MLKRDVTHTVDTRYLPTKWRDAIWTNFDDPSLIVIGTVLFDPHPGAYYAGEVYAIQTVHNHTWVHIRWYKTHDATLTDSKTDQHLAAARLWWIDPVMQE